MLHHRHLLTDLVRLRPLDLTANNTILLLPRILQNPPKRVDEQAMSITSAVTKFPLLRRGAHPDLVLDRARA